MNPTVKDLRKDRQCVAIIWRSWQQYHIDRFRALKREASKRGLTTIGISVLETPDGIHLSALASNQEDVITCVRSAKGLSEWTIALEVWKVLNQIDPKHVFIIGYEERFSIVALAWTKLFRRSGIMMLESKFDDQPRQLAKEVVKSGITFLFDGVLAGGTPQFRYAQILLAHPGKIRTGYDCVDNLWWRQATAGLDRERYFLIYGRLIAKKDCVGALKAFSKYVARSTELGIPPFRLEIVGSGPEGPRIHDEIRSFGLGSLVGMRGYMNRSEVVKWVGRSACVVLPSSHFEQWGLVVNEALASGTPAIVSTACGCVPDLVEEGKTGFAFQPRNYEQLAECMWQVAQLSSQERIKMGEHCVAKVAKFSLDNFAENACGLIGKLSEPKEGVVI